MSRAALPSTSFAMPYPNGVITSTPRSSATQADDHSSHTAALSRPNSRRSRLAGLRDDSAAAFSRIRCATIAYRPRPSSIADIATDASISDFRMETLSTLMPIGKRFSRT